MTYAARAHAFGTGEAGPAGNPWLHDAPQPPQVTELPQDPAQRPGLAPRPAAPAGRPAVDWSRLTPPPVGAPPPIAAAPISPPQHPPHQQPVHQRPRAQGRDDRHPATPQPAGFGPGAPPVRAVLQRRYAPLWVLGAHGGAGEDTIAPLVAGAQSAGHAWPYYPPNPDGSATLPRVVLVARTHLAGLQAAQQAAGQWALGHAPPAHLVGLVLSADAPGRLPRPLRELVDLVAGGVPRVWQLPWIESWRMGEHPLSLPRPLAQLLTDLTALSTTPPQQGAHRCTP